MKKTYLKYGLSKERHEFEFPFSLDRAELTDLKIHPDFWQILIFRLEHDFFHQILIEPMGWRPDVRHEVGDEVHGDVHGLATQDDAHEMAVVHV